MEKDKQYGRDFHNELTVRFRGYGKVYGIGSKKVRVYDTSPPEQSKCILLPVIISAFNIYSYNYCSQFCKR